MERKCIKCIHFPCLKVQCEAQNTEVCDLYETEVSRAIKKLREEGYYDFERREIGGNMREKYRFNVDEEQAIEYLKNDIRMNREKYKEIEAKGEPTGYGTMHDIHKLNICEYTILLNLIDKLKDVIENKVHYIRCSECGCEVGTKRSDAKYCKKCSSKQWYKNLSEDKKKERREKAKLSMRKIRKGRS